MAGERPVRFRATGVGNQASTIIRASDAVGAANDASSRLSPRVCRLRFSADAAAAFLLRTAAFGGASDTDFLGAYRIASVGGTDQIEFKPGDADVPPTRDLYYTVTAAGGVNWTLESETDMR